MVNSKDEFIQEIKNLETTKEKGDYFLKTLCSEFFPDEDINYLDGSGDGGIDAFFTSSNNWSIIQSKYGSSYKGVDSICSEFSKIFLHLDDECFEGKDSTFIYLRDFIKNNKSTEKSITLYLLTSEKINISDLEIFNIIKTNLSEKYNTKFEIENLYINLLFSDKLSVEKSYEIKLSGSFIKDDGSGELVGKIKFNDLYTLMKNYETLTGDIKLFYKSNIRLFLSNKLAKSITETVSKEPGKFFQRNNGITILTNGIKKDSESTLILTNPDCINGCQTSWNIYKYINNSKVIPEGFLSITIIDVSKISKEDKIKITECRNRQTAVKTIIDVFDDKNQIIKNILLTDFKKPLQTRKGEFSSKTIELSDLVGICFCIAGYPGIAKLRKEVDYRSKTGIGFIEKLSSNKDFLILVYRLAEILEDLKKKSNKYYIGLFKYVQVSVLYNLINKAIEKENYKKYLDILNNPDLFDYFIKASTTIVKTYTDINRTPAKYVQDYGNNNLDLVSRGLTLDSAEKLKDLISFWYEDVYSVNTEIINKIKVD